MNGASLAMEFKEDGIDHEESLCAIMEEFKRRRNDTFVLS
jgi:hypothetical protein